LTCSNKEIKMKKKLKSKKKEIYIYIKIINLNNYIANILKLITID